MYRLVYLLMYLFAKNSNILYKPSFSEPDSDSDTFNVSGGREKPLGTRECVPVNAIL